MNPVLALLLRLCLLVATGLGPLAAQGSGRLPERIFGEEHGLASLAIYTLVQDQQGFLWAGTEAGLHRFDGHRWELLDLDLPNSWVEYLFPDSQGRLWIGCRSGLAVWAEGRLQRVEAISSRVTHLGEDREGRIWVLASGGPQVLANGTWSKVTPTDGPDEPTAMYLSKASSEVWLVGGRSLWVGNGREPWRVDRLPLDPKRETLVGVAPDGKGLLWARSNLKVWYRPTAQTGGWKSRLGDTDGESPDNPCVIRDAEGSVWVTTLHGPVRLRGTELEAYTQGGQFPNPTALLVDREGSLWIGTGGIHQVLGRGAWRVYGRPEGLPSPVVWNLLRDDRGRLWAASEGGLCVAEPSGWRVVKRGFFVRLAKGPGGVIYATGHPGGVVHRLDPDRERVEAIRVDCLQSGPELRGLGVDKEGRVFVSNLQDGVAMGTPRNGQLHWSLVGLPKGIPTDVWHLVEDRWKRILLLTQKSVHLWDGQWASVEGLLNLIPYGVLALAEDRILVTYFNKAALSVHRRGPSGWQLESSWEPLKGVPNLIIYSSRLGKEGSLWLGTNKGLLRIPEEGRGTPQWFRPREGIPGADPTYDCLSLDGDGSVWVGTSQGLGRMDASVRSDRSDLPAPQILAIRSKGIALDPAGSIQIKHGESLEVAYAVNSWRHPASVRFESRILGLEESWVGSELPVLRYPSLPAGRHKLVLRATRGSEDSSPNTELSFEVLPAWWQSLPARAAYLLAASGLVMALFQLRQRQLRNRNATLSEQVEARTAELEETNLHLAAEKRRADDASRAKSAFLASMSHELRTPLNAILLYSELLAEDAEAREDGRSLSDLLKIRASGHHLLSMLNTVLDLSKIEAGKMELAVEMISPEILMAEVRDTLLPQARKGGNDLVVELGTGIHWFPTDATKLRQVLLNLGSNACKFTHHGRVTLGLEGQPEGTLFIVRDTGIGMNAEQAKRVFLPYEQAEATTSTRYGGTGLGLALSTKYVELMGGTISLQSELGQGTAVTVQIPWEPPAAG